MKRRKAKMMMKIKKKNNERILNIKYGNLEIWFKQKKQYFLCVE